MPASTSTKAVEAVGGAIGAVIIVTVIAGAAALAQGWLLMLFLGVLHAEIATAVPPVGYWPCVGLAFLASAVVGGITRARHTTTAPGK